MNEKFEKGYVPEVPSLVLTGTSGNVKIVRKLYGPVTPGRVAVETADVQRQAEALNPAKFMKPQEYDWRDE